MIEMDMPRIDVEENEAKATRRSSWSLWKRASVSRLATA